MNFRDQPVICAECGKTFIFSVTEQRRLYESGHGVLNLRDNEMVAPAQCPSCGLKDPETGRLTGRVKWFSAEKGYGFIVKPNNDEIFFHRTQVLDDALASLEEGIQVTFDEISTDRGVEARQVRVESQ